MFNRNKLILKETIKIPGNSQLIPWLRFINESRSNVFRYSKRDLIRFDLTFNGVIQPHQFTSLACLIEEYKNKGATIEIKSKKQTPAGQFIKSTKFDKYWNNNFDKDFCLKSDRDNIIPIWKFNKERLDAYANLILNFYSAHAMKGKDLTRLRLTIVEALNNINDHSKSEVGGFIYTQYYPKSNELIISICDFGIGIPKSVQNYYKAMNLGKISDDKALIKALELNFTTGSMPYNAGKGLDNILDNVSATSGEIIIVSNSAFYSNSIKDGYKADKTEIINLKFKGTYIKVKLNTSKFLDQEEEEAEEMSLI